MKCILCKIIFERIFICKTNSISNLFTLLCWRNFSLAKSVCYKDEDGTGHASRSSGLLRLVASRVRDWWRSNVDGACGIIVDVVWISS
jgi:hypothetical protein